MVFDYRKLLGRIVEKFGTQAKFASAIGLSERSVSLKLNNRVYWKQIEIEAARTALCLDESDIPEYFFANKAQSD